MGLQMNEFLVDTNGCCFLCFKQNETVPITNQTKEGHSSSSIYSLHCLSTYLDMDMRKVFKEEGSIPPSLLNRVERSRVKVELCQGCGSITEKIAGLYLQLEKIKMEMTDCLKVVHGKLINTVGNNEARSFEVASINGDPKFNLMEKAIFKLEVANILRAEAVEKCRNEISLDAPRVKVERLRKMKTQLNPYQLKKGINLNIKTENCSSPPDPIPDDNADETESNHSNDLSPNWELHDTDEEEWNHQGFSRPEDPDIDALKPGRTRGRTSPSAGISSKSNKILPDLSIFNPQTGRHKCIRCSKEFTAARNIYSHFNSAHLQVRYKCSVSECGKEFTQLGSYKRHQMTVHMKVRFNCETCSRTFTTKSTLKVHQQIEHFGRRIPCKFCNLTFKSFAGRGKHVKVYHRNK